MNLLYKEIVLFINYNIVFKIPNSLIGIYNDINFANINYKSQDLSLSSKISPTHTFLSPSRTN